VEGKRHAADFAIWRRTPAGESRQMEWDSPWGRGAPGWHLECSVMSEALLGFPFDIHTGGIDHREIHHPNEIAQNQAFRGCDHSGAKLWMHNNFLVQRSGKMSKSAGEFLRLQLLIDKGYHPLAYRLMCLQAHYRSELEFSWEGLGAALTRLKRMVIGIERLREKAAAEPEGQEHISLHQVDEAISDDLNTGKPLIIAESIAGMAGYAADRLQAIYKIDELLGLTLSTLTRGDLRLRPRHAVITEAEIEAALARRKEARAAKDFATSDAIRAELAGEGVDVMDGDPLGWEWRLG
jgi:cysteinyl-tRNA synthetase